MIDYIEYLGFPATITVSLIALFFVLQAIGEILEIKGKVVPEFLKVRKYFARKKLEREILHQVPETLGKVQKSIDDFMSHYSADNIHKRDDWIESVNQGLRENDRMIKELDRKIDKNNADTLSLLIESQRNSIIDFASKVVDENYSVTREQFNRIMKLYKDYENLIAQNGLTNGEVDIAYRIITESYETHLKNHTFIEDIRGYGV